MQYPPYSPPQQPVAPPAQPARQPSFWKRPVGPGTILAIVLGVVVVRGFMIETTIVEGKSMEPTLHADERLLVSKLSYRSRIPERFDIVTFPDPTEPDSLVVKRVIGLPGETVSIRGTSVFINGMPLDDPHAKGSVDEALLPQAIPPDMVFVLGDNWDGSMDSRDYGPVQVEKIRGKAVFVFYPLNRFGPLK